MEPRESVGAEFGAANSHGKKKNYSDLHPYPGSFKKLQITTSKY